MAVDPQQILDNIENAILQLSLSVNATVNFNGQSFTKKNLPELQQARTYWKAEVIRLQPSPTNCPARYGPRFLDA